DIHIDVPAVNYKEMRAATEPEGSAQIRERIVRAREIQLRRFKAHALIRASSTAKGTETRLPAMGAEDNVPTTGLHGSARQFDRSSLSRSIFSNAQMTPRHIRAFCELSPDCERLLERAMTQQGLTARAHDRILKVARTVADLEASEKIQPKHIAE